MPILKVYQGEKRTDISFEGQRKVSELLEAHGILYPHPCGGRGVCGKCRIEVEGAVSKPDALEKQAGWRLSCRAVVLGDAVVRLPEQSEMVVEGVDASTGTATAAQELTCAVDIGTTTVVLRVFAGEKPVFSDGFRNPQSAIAADVMGRIAHEMKEREGAGDDYRSAMKEMICGTIRERLVNAGLFEKITRFVMTGNTTMLYLLTGRDPKALSAFPFEADELFDRTEDFFGVPMYLPRCMHAFVGADITCSVLASGMCGNEKINLLCDVGTNGEIALYKNGKLYVSSTAAGPAFEGAGIECGCQGVPGAIEKVELAGDELEVKTIGGGAAVGICGSGLIDAVAALLAREDLDETGYLEDEEVTLSGDVYLTQKDIRNVQLAKGAVCAGILTVLEASDTSVEEVDTFYIAGGFGSHLDVRTAAAIGLFPQELVEKAKVIGNAALKGAEMILLSDAAREESLRITAMAEHVDLGGSAVFNDNYVECMMF